MKKVPMIVKKILVALAIGLPIAALPLKQSAGVVTNQSTSTTTALGDGATVDYTIGFTFQSNTHVHVFLRDESFTPATSTEIIQGVGSSKFSITGGDPGTTVHMGTAPTATQRLVIERVMPFTQTVDYEETEAFPAADHEEQMDKQVLLLQQIQADVDTKIGLALGSIATAPTIPDPAADRFLVYDHAGVDLTVAPSTAPASGQVLKFGGTAWSLFDLDTPLATFTSHIANTSNPHSVTAAQVGNGTAQWNANKIKDVTVDATNIANGRLLSYNSGSGNIEYVAPGLPTLANAHLFVGVSGTPTDLAVSGDLTLQNTGAFTVATVGGQVASAISTSVGLTGAATATKTNGAIVKRDGSGAAALDVTGNLTGNVTGNVTGALTGNASTATSATTATTATTATNATNAATVATSTNALYFPMFAASSTNSNQPFNLGTGLTFNPSSNNLTTTTFTGALTGHASLDCALGGCTMTGAISGTSLSLSTPLPIGSGGTGQATKAPAFDALSPMTTGGDLIYGGASGTGTRLANGNSGQFLKSNGTTLAPTWSNPTIALTVPTVQKFLATGTTTGYLFTVTSANATVGATYTNNGNTYTVLGTIAAGTQLFTSQAAAPLASGTLTKASGTGDATITFSANVALGTYTPAAGTLYVKVKALGGGAGGGGSTATGSAGTSGSGGTTFFGANIITATGGIGVTNSGTQLSGGAGGSATISSPATSIIAVSGGSGQGNSGFASGSFFPGGMGGGSFLGGAGGGNTANVGGSPGLSAATNSGSGGGGAGGNSAATFFPGGGGGAGAYAEATLSSLSASYPYLIGNGGAGGTAGGGSGAAAGGAGGAGMIVVEEFYQ